MNFSLNKCIIHSLGLTLVAVAFLLPSLTLAYDSVANYTGSGVIDGQTTVNNTPLSTYNFTDTGDPITNIYIKHIKQITEVESTDNMIYFVLKVAGTPIDCYSPTRLRSAWGIELSSAGDDSPAGDLDIPMNGTECYRSSADFTISVVGFADSQALRAQWDNGTDSTFTFDVTSGGTPYVTYPGTQWIDLTPSGGSTIGNTGSETVGFSLYTAVADYESDMYVTIKYYRDATIASPNTNLANLWTVIPDIPVDYQGFFFDDTTASFTDIGRYTIRYELRRPSTVNNVLGWFGLGSLYDNGLIIATTTHIIASTTSAHDDFVDARVARVEEFTNATTTPIDTSSCGIGAFDLSDCFDVLFGWHTPAMTSVFTDIKDGFLSYAPFGYVTRTVEILSSTATTSIPEISFTFADDFPIEALQEQEFSFDVFSDEAQTLLTEEIVSTGDNPLNVWDIFSDIITSVIYMWLLYIIFFDLMKIRGGHGTKNKTL